jgi:hypothetical protein
VEILHSFLGTGCESVHCHHTDEYDIVIGSWSNGRSGTLRGIRNGAAGYAATVFGSEAVRHTTYATDVPFYSQLLKEVVPFLRGGTVPVPIQETLEIVAFMRAELLSTHEKRAVLLSEVSAAKVRVLGAVA